MLEGIAEANADKRQQLIDRFQVTAV